MWFWGDVPLLPVHRVTLSLHFSTDGSLLQVQAGTRRAGLSCREPSGLGQEKSWPSCGEPAVVLVCLAVSELSSFGGSLECVHFSFSLGK